MADKEIVIDVVSKYTDHASQGLNQTGKDAEKVEKELNNLERKDHVFILMQTIKQSLRLTEHEKKEKGLERNDGLQRLELMTKQLLKFVELHRLD